MNYILYGSRGSGSLAIELALSEAGVPFRVEESRGHDARAYKARRSMGEIINLFRPGFASRHFGLRSQVADRHMGG